MLIVKIILCLPDTLICFQLFNFSLLMWLIANHRCFFSYVLDSTQSAQAYLHLYSHIQPLPTSYNLDIGLQDYHVSVILKTDGDDFWTAIVKPTLI
ncbi:hypothetical protein Hanom_Chr01g00045921 [Helianthus anomalus]